MTKARVKSGYVQFYREQAPDLNMLAIIRDGDIVDIVGDSNLIPGRIHVTVDSIHAHIPPEFLEILERN